MKALSFQSYMKTSGHKERILVVDDEDKILAVISEYFIIQGYEVRTAIDAKEALQEFTPGKFHCVISDFSMPGMDGIELLKDNTAVQNTTKSLITSNKISPLDG